MKVSDPTCTAPGCIRYTCATCDKTQPGDLNYFAYLVDMGNVSINGKLMNDIDLR